MLELDDAKHGHFGYKKLSQAPYLKVSRGGIPRSELPATDAASIRDHLANTLPPGEYELLAEDTLKWITDNWDTQHVQDSLIEDGAKSIWNLLDEIETSGTPASKKLPNDIKVALRRASLTLGHLSNIYSEKGNQIHEYTRGRLIEHFLYVLGDAVISPDSIDEELFIRLLAETDVLRFVTNNSDREEKQEILSDATNDQSTLDTPDKYNIFENVFMSDDIDREEVQPIVDEYQIAFDEFIDNFGKMPRLFSSLFNPDYRMISGNHKFKSPLARGYKRYDHIANPWHDESFKPQAANAMQIGNLVMLNEDDFENCFDPVVRQRKTNRFWVLDATMADSIVFTPNGIRNLLKNKDKLKSNARHEIVHYFLNKFSLFSNPEFWDTSKQYLLPKWFIEGLCNVWGFSQRGRTEDGFRQEWIELFNNSPELKAEEIMKDGKLNYLYYTLLTYFLFSASHSVKQGLEKIHLLPAGNAQLVSSSLTLAQLNDTLTEMKLDLKEGNPGNKNLRKMFNMFFNKFKDSNKGGINTEFDNLMEEFDRNFRTIGEAYFHKSDEFVELV
jgi:hypothetical protein